MERIMRRLNGSPLAALALRAPQGLHVLRYASAGRSATPPRVMLAPPDAGAGELLLPPGMSEPVLEAPGDGVVVRALGDMEIAYAVEAGGEAVLAIEPVSSLVRPQTAQAFTQPRLADTPYRSPVAVGARSLHGPLRLTVSSCSAMWRGAVTFQRKQAIGWATPRVRTRSKASSCAGPMRRKAWMWPCG
jgi:hypothetical protein